MAVVCDRCNEIIPANEKPFHLFGKEYCAVCRDDIKAFALAPKIKEQPKQPSKARSFVGAMKGSLDKIAGNVASNIDN